MKTENQNWPSKESGRVRQFYWLFRALPLSISSNRRNCDLRPWLVRSGFLGKTENCDFIKLTFGVTRANNPETAFRARWEPNVSWSQSTTTAESACSKKWRSHLARHDHRSLRKLSLSLPSSHCQSAEFRQRRAFSGITIFRGPTI